jgi:4-hydroxybenzoate polyprenyltransferase
MAVMFGNLAPTVNKVDISQTDAYHYQVQAVNLVKYFSYPKLNLNAPPDVYYIDTLQRMGYSSYLMLQLLRHHPPVDDFTKPPLYSVVIAAIYALCGVNPQYVVNFHLFLVMFIAIAQLFIGVRLLNLVGIPIGILTAWVYYKLTIPDIVNFYPHFLVQFFLLIVFWLRIDGKKNLNIRYSVIVGLALGLMVLTNGNIVFIPVLLFSYQFIRCVKRGQFKSFLFMVLTFGLTLAPWVFFANWRLTATQHERDKWVERIEQGVKVKKLNDGLFQNQLKQTFTDSLIMSYCIQNIYKKFCTDGYVIISKQPFGDEILGAHNEFSHDGNFHPEWRFLKYSYYNTHPSNSVPVVRICRFYYDSPRSLVRNILGKFRATSYFLSPVYLFAWLLVALISIWNILNIKTYKFLLLLVCIAIYLTFPFAVITLLLCGCSILILIAALFSNKLWNVPHMFSFALLNTIIITVLFIGVPRYVQIIDPILLLSVAAISLRFFIKPIKKLVGQLITTLTTHIKRLRIGEVLLMSGYFWVAALTATSYIPEPNINTLLLCISVVCYIASVYCLNSFTDYEPDKSNPRLLYLSQAPRHYYLYWLLAFTVSFVCLSYYANISILYFQTASFLLWVLYYQKPFQLKARFPWGTVIHFTAGILHFQIGYEIVWGWGFISFMVSLFFASMLSLGHLNHERIDADADKQQGVRTGSALFGSNVILALFYTGFILSQAYWCLLLKWQLISVELWLSFFQLPVILLIGLTPYRNNLVTPYGIQKIFRFLMLIGFVVFLIGKLMH